MTLPVTNAYQDFNPNFELEIFEPRQTKGNFKDSRVYQLVRKGQQLELEALFIAIIGVGASLAFIALTPVTLSPAFIAIPAGIGLLVSGIISGLKISAAESIYREAMILQGEVPLFQ